MVQAVRTGEIGAQAPAFALPGVDGRTWRLDDFAGARGLVVVFICNHCPYVRAITGRLVADVADMKALGIETVAINSNDAAAYPADSFRHMVTFASERHFNFPYLHDESQEVARAYDAVCTPDFFGFDGDGRLQYRGRLDAGRTEVVDRAAVRRDLVEAMRMIVETGKGPAEQVPSVGCSIKWRR